MGCRCFSYANLLRLLFLLVVGLLMSQVFYFWRGRRLPEQTVDLSAASGGATSLLRGSGGIAIPSEMVAAVAASAAERAAAATAASTAPAVADKPLAPAAVAALPQPAAAAASTLPAEAHPVTAVATVVCDGGSTSASRCAAGDAAEGAFAACRGHHDNEADVKALACLPATVDMATWIAAGGRYPILLVTCDRAAEMEATLTRLLGVRGVDKADVLVVVDACAVEATQAIHALCDDAGVAHHQNPREIAPHGADGAARIASAYGYALKHAFETAFPRAPGVVVVEDDMAFSPDFFEYFHAIAGVLDRDQGTWLASAWHDNGFDYLVADPFALRRTRYFPGLGWLLPRRIWEDELCVSWPSTHWDHWMRDPAQHRGRDVIVPEISRDYHMGVKGTFMDLSTHNDLFGSIALHNDPTFSWDSEKGVAAVEGVLTSNYEARIVAALSSPATRHLSSASELASLTEGEAVLWYAAPPEHDHAAMRPLARFIGIWHEAARGSREGVHELWWQGTAKVWLINANAGPHQPNPPITGASAEAPAWVKILMPASLVPVDARNFVGHAHPVLPRHITLFNARFESPLAHLSGGHDRNGPPDAVANAMAVADVSTLHRSGNERGFMSTLRLPDVEPLPIHVAAVLALFETYAIASDKSGLSCTDVCSAAGRKCNVQLFSNLNTCAALQSAFPCASCVESVGPDQPAYVSPNAPKGKHPGLCLVNGGDYSCEGKWQHASRLCPCTV